ncbi:MAG: MFS transporter [Chloroflexi bacterium]|nr:MFS transporter [Chloroflexota bacterium]
MSTEINLLTQASLETSETQRRNNLFVLASNSFLRGAHTSIYNVIWQPFALSLGASMPTIGLLSSIGGMSGIFTTLAQSFGGWLADRIGRKPFIVAASLFIIVAYALLAIAGALNIWGLLLGAIVLLGLSALSRPALSAMTAESAQRGQHGSAFSLTMVASLVPGILAPTLGGWLAQQIGFVGVFPVLLALEVLALALAWRYLRETRDARDAINLRDLGRAVLRSILPPKGLRGFFIATAGDSFSWAMGWGLINGMLRDSYNFSVEQLGIMASVMSLSWALMQMPIGRWVDRHGLKGIMVFSESLGIPLMAIWLTQTSFEWFLVGQVLFALTAATWVPVVNTYLTRSVSAAERSEAFGRLNMFRGLIAFPASWLGGILYAWGGIHAPLAANLIGVFAVVAMLILFVNEPNASQP